MSGDQEEAGFAAGSLDRLDHGIATGGLTDERRDIYDRNAVHILPRGWGRLHCLILSGVNMAVSSWRLDAPLTTEMMSVEAFERRVAKFEIFLQRHLLEI